MKKGFLAITIFLLIIVSWLIYKKEHKPQSSLVPGVTKFDLYSLNGRIDLIYALSINSLTVTETVVEKQANGSAKVTTQTRHIGMTFDTQIVLDTVNHTTIPGKFSDLKVGQNIIVYTAQNPLTTPNLTAKKIEILYTQPKAK